MNRKLLKEDIFANARINDHFIDYRRLLIKAKGYRTFKTFSIHHVALKMTKHKENKLWQALAKNKTITSAKAIRFNERFKEVKQRHAIVVKISKAITEKGEVMVTLKETFFQLFKAEITYKQYSLIIAAEKRLIVKRTIAYVPKGITGKSFNRNCNEVEGSVVPFRSIITKIVRKGGQFSSFKKRDHSRSKQIDPRLQGNLRFRLLQPREDIDLGASKFYAQYPRYLAKKDFCTTKDPIECSTCFTAILSKQEAKQRTEKSTQQVSKQQTKEPYVARVPNGAEIIKNYLRNKVTKTFESEYKLGKYLGGGGFGKVYEAIQRRSNEKVVVKFIKKDSPEDTSVLDEVEWLKKLKHRNVVEMVEYFTTETEIIIALKKHGERVLTLEQHADKLGGRIPEATLKFIMIQVILAVLYLHNNKCCHFDIKSANIIINEKLQVRLIDFGLAAKAALPDEELYYGAFGTVFNTTPEMQYNHRFLGPEADVWSIAVTTFKLLTGTYPFEFNSRKTVYFPKGNTMPTIKAKSSEALRQFLSFALTRHCRYRPKIKELVLHQWFQNMEKLDATALKPFQN